MTTFLRTFAVGTVALATLAAPAAAQRQEQQALEWTGRLAPGKSVIVRNLNGEISVSPSTDGRASIIATKSWRRGRPEQVRVELRRVGGEDGTVIACAFWNEGASCDEDEYRGGRNRKWNWNDDDGPGDVSVRFEVRLPKGVPFVTSSINGGIAIDGATSRVDAETVNGSISARTSGGPVRARTVNGALDVVMGGGLTEDLEFETVNGGISLTIPEGLDADLSMKTVNGTVQTDFPVTLTGRINPKKLNATLGKGGRRLSLETVNGSVRLRKG